MTPEPQNRRLILLLLLFWLIGMIVAWQTNHITELLIVSSLVIVFIIVTIKDGLVTAEILEKPLYTELLVNLPYHDTYDQCIKSLAIINGDIESSNKAWGQIVAIPIGVSVINRYSPLYVEPFIFNDRISFELIRESISKTRIKIRHNLEKGSTFKIQKEEEKMKKIENYLRQWEVKTPEGKSDK